MGAKTDEGRSEDHHASKSSRRCGRLEPEGCKDSRTSLSLLEPEPVEVRVAVLARRSSARRKEAEPGAYPAPLPCLERLAQRREVLPVGAVADLARGVPRDLHAKV